MTPSAISHPHDLLVRLLLSEPETAASLLKNYLDKETLDVLDLRRLKCENPISIDDSLKETLSDFRFSTKFKKNAGNGKSGEDVDVIVFMEHQSTSDRFMMVRVAACVFRMYLQRISEKPREKTLPHVVAVILYHGKKPWGKLHQVSDLVQKPRNVEQGLVDFQCPVTLIDLPSIPTEELKGDPVVRALLDALQSASTNRLPDRFQAIISGLRGILNKRRLEAVVTALTNYMTAQYNVDVGVLRRAFATLFSKKEADSMATTFMERYRQEGILEGEAKGEAKGEVKGEAKMLVAVLAARFGEIPASIEKKIFAMGDSKRLEALAQTVASCRDLNEFKKAL